MIPEPELVSENHPIIDDFVDLLVAVNDETARKWHEKTLARLLVRNMKEQKSSKVTREPECDYSEEESGGKGEGERDEVDEASDGSVDAACDGASDGASDGDNVEESDGDIDRESDGASGRSITTDIDGESATSDGNNDEARAEIKEHYLTKKTGISPRISHPVINLQARKIVADTVFTFWHCLFTKIRRWLFVEGLQRQPLVRKFKESTLRIWQGGKPTKKINMLPLTGNDGRLTYHRLTRIKKSERLHKASDFRRLVKFEAWELRMD